MLQKRFAQQARQVTQTALSVRSTLVRQSEKKSRPIAINHTLFVCTPTFNIVRDKRIGGVRLFAFACFMKSLTNA